MKHCLYVIRKEKKLILAFVFLGILIAFLDAYQASLYQNVLDSLTAGTLTGTRIALFAVVLLGSYLINYLQEWPNTKLSQALVLDFKMMALQKLEYVKYQSYQSLGTGMLLQRVNNGAEAGKGILFDFWMRVIAEVLPAIGFSLFYIAQIDAGIMLWLGVGYVLVFLISKVLLKALYRIKEKILDNEELFSRRFVRALMELVVFRTNRKFKKEIEETQKAADTITGSKARMRMVHELFFTLFALFIGAIKIAVILYALSGAGISVGAVVALLILVDKAYQPIAIFNVLYVQYKLDLSAYKRYTDYLDMPDEERLHGGNALHVSDGSIAFEHVSFRYDERPVLRDVTLRLASGGSYAFVGESGGGKSTAIKLLAGLLTPSEGVVSIDGQDLANIDLNTLYANIAYAGQEAPVFEGTLRENLAMDLDIPDAELLCALDRVSLGHLLETLPQGLDTPIGEKGTLLSGGERQRLALARISLSNARIVLLDEATSALDNTTEEAVVQSLTQILRGKTVLMIAHRLSTVKHTDRIFVFDQGTVAQQGAFAELLQQEGLFKRLWDAGKAKDEE